MSDNTPWPPGHPYSPIPDFARVGEMYDHVLKRSGELLEGINLQVEAQLAFLSALAPYCADAPFPVRPAPEWRFHFQNGLFEYGDACALFAILRHIRPARVFEAGSAPAAALILDTVEHFLNPRPHVTLLNPDKEWAAMFTADLDPDGISVVDQQLEELPLDLFAQLTRGDILFVDTSHVLKFGSDVSFLISGILPVLERGVLVHFHDIFWPFEYPKDWFVNERRAWNEAYVLRAFLQFNDRFEILLFNHYLALHHPKLLPPLWRRNPGGSLWLRKR